MYKFISYAVTIFLLCFSFNAYAKNDTEKVSLLKKYYELCVNNPDSVKYQLLFFDTFPKSFDELNSIYGYSEKPAPLYFDSHDHISGLFENLNGIIDEIYCTRLIDVSIGGHWDADAINDFQKVVHTFVLKNPKLTLHLLSQRSEIAIESFFYFFFHGIHPPFKSVPEVFQKCQDQYPEMYKLLLNGFNQAINDSGH